MPTAQQERRRTRRTFTMADETYEHLTSLAEGISTSRSRFLEQLVLRDHEAYERLTAVAAGVEVTRSEFLNQSVFLDADVYERVTNMATQARATRTQFLEHLILRSEAIYKFQPPLPSRKRSWWKFWEKEYKPELPAIVVDLRNLPPH